MRSAVVELLCLPCAGASATMYLRWRRLLPEWIRVVPIELPGRGMKLGEPFIEDFDALLDRLAAQVPGLATGRYALFGHSMGGLLAHALARQLAATSLPQPQALFVSACAAPSARDPERFVGLDDAALIADLRQQGGTPEAVFADEELRTMALQALRADYRVCASFVHDGCAAPLSIPLHVLAGRHDRIPPRSMQAWQGEAAAPITLDWFDGGHFFIREHEERVLQAIVRELLHGLLKANHAVAAAA